MISCGNRSTSPAAGSKDRLQGDIEALLLGPRAVIGEIEALLDQGIDIDRPVLAGALTRMQQHVLDDGVGALAVLHDLVEIALQHIGNLADLGAQLAVEVCAGKRLAQFVNEFDRDGREIVDEIERVLDLVRDAGGQLAERGELLGLNQAVLRGRANPPATSPSSRVRASTLSNRRTFSIAIAAWSAKVDTSSICLSVNGRTSERVSASTPIGTPSRSIGTPRMVRKPPSLLASSKV